MSWNICMYVHRIQFSLCAIRLTTKLRCWDLLWVLSLRWGTDLCIRIVKRRCESSLISNHILNPIKSPTSSPCPPTLPSWFLLWLSFEFKTFISIPVSITRSVRWAILLQTKLGRRPDTNDLSCGLWKIFCGTKSKKLGRLKLWDLDRPFPKRMVKMQNARR